MDRSQLDRQLIVDSIKMSCCSLNNLKPTFKSAEKVNEFRLDGHYFYKKGKPSDEELKAIHESYSKCIAYAPTNSPDLVMAYGNRSALLHRMNKYQESVSDIDKALEILNESDLEYKSKLLCRKVECLASLGLSESKKVYQEVVQLEQRIRKKHNNNSISTSLRKAEEALSKISPEHIPKRKTNRNARPLHEKILFVKAQENPLASVSVGHDKLGKHLLANQDLEPGQIIFTERAYASCLNLKDAYSYCSHCLKRSWTSIPCDKCNWCMFCSTECKNLAWENYHDIECTVISYYLSAYSTIHHQDHSSLRILIKGIKESGSLENFRIDLQSVDDWLDQCIEGSVKDQIFQSNGFKSVYALRSNATTHMLRECAHTTARILMILSKFTSFFGENPNVKSYEEILQNERIMSIGLAYMKLRKKSYTNTFVYHGNSHPLVACSSHLSSFISHSCNPNTKLCITDDQRIVVYSLQPIKKGTQLLSSCQYAFYEEEKLVRNNWLRSHTAQMCGCDSCRQTWPTLNEMYELPKVNPLLYAKTYKQEESDLFDEFDPLTGPILKNHSLAKYDQTTVKHLSKALLKAMESLDQPSVVISELMLCISLVFEKLYGPSLRRLYQRL